MSDTSTSSSSNGKKSNGLWSYILRTSEESKRATLYGDDAGFREARINGSTGYVPEKDVIYLLDFDERESAFISKVRENSEDFELLNNMFQKVREQLQEQLRIALTSLPVNPVPANRVNLGSGE